MPNNPKISHRLKEFIFNAFLTILLICHVFLLIFSYLKSSLFLPVYPDLFWKYIAAVIIPLLIVKLILLLLLNSKIKHIIREKYFIPIFIKKTSLVFVLTLLFLLVSFFPNPDIALIYLIVTFSLVIIFWSVMVDSLDVILVSWFPLIFMYVLIIINLIPAQGLWGRVTHKYNFRIKEPIIGPGGRLIPNLNIFLKGLDNHVPRKFITNSDGFRNDIEFKKDKTEDEIRILNLGDSFSIGYHLDQNKFLGPLIEKKIKDKTSQNASVLNSAISDPAYGLYYLQKFGLDYNPDLIVLGICGNDFTQAYSFAGPNQRFHIKNHKIEINKDYNSFLNPSKEFKSYVYKSNVKAEDMENNSRYDFTNILPFYTFIGFKKLSAVRYLSSFLDIRNDGMPRNYEVVKSNRTHRNKESLEQNPIANIPLIDGFPNIGFYLKKDTYPVNEIYKKNFEILKSYKNYCDEKGIKFMLLYYPVPFEIIPKEWKRLCNNWGLNHTDFDLSKHRNKISDFSKEIGISFQDLTEVLINSNKKDKLFLPLDAHLSELGHNVIAEKLSSDIVNILK